MADNVVIKDGTGANQPVATDDVAGVQFQRIKLDFGLDGASRPVVPSDGLPVNTGLTGLATDVVAQAIRDRLPAALSGGKLSVDTGLAGLATDVVAQAIRDRLPAALLGGKLSVDTGLAGLATDVVAQAIRDRLPAALLGGKLSVDTGLTGLATDVVAQAIRDRLNDNTIAIRQFNALNQELVMTLDPADQSVMVYAFGLSAYTGALLFEALIDGVWQNVNGTLTGGAVASQLTSFGAGSQVVVLVPTYGATQFRLRMSAFTAGSFVGVIRPSPNNNISQTTITNTQLIVVGFIGHGGAIASSSNPVVVAFESRTTRRTSTADAQASRPVVDILGRQIVKIGQNRELQDGNRVVLANATETTLIPAIASVFNDITGVVIDNQSGAAETVSFRDSTAGTVRLSVTVPAGQTLLVTLAQNVIKQSTVNSNWTVQKTGATANVAITALSERI